MLSRVPRAAEVPLPGYGPRAAEVPFFALFDASVFTRPVGHLGQSMLKVAPLGKRVLNGGLLERQGK